MVDYQYWLGLTQIHHLGTVRLRQLIAFFGSPEAVWKASDSQLRDCGLAMSVAEQFITQRRTLNLEAELDRVLMNGARLISIDDAAYPKPLLELADAPLLLYIKGDWLPTDERALAIVGTRKATQYGRDAAFSIARQVAEQHVTIISGLAQGIDSAAHHGALAANGRTIAVLGTGIDQIYPPENQNLAQQIIRNGAIITELPIGTPPSGRNFPRRNRLISGLSQGVLIAEAPEKSGALITADAALEQGKEVFAVPSNIFNPMGRGCNRLIQEGAQLVMRISDVLNGLNVAYTQTQTRQQAEQIVPENDTETLILKFLESDPIHIDELIRRSGLAAEVVSSTLTILELKGLAQMVGHMQYCRMRAL